MSAETMLYPASPQEFVRATRTEFLADVLGEDFTDSDSLPATLAVTKGPKATFFTKYLSTWNALEQVYRNYLTEEEVDGIDQENLITLHDIFIQNRYHHITAVHDITNESIFRSHEGQNLAEHAEKIHTYKDRPEELFAWEPSFHELLEDVEKLISPTPESQ